LLVGRYGVYQYAVVYVTLIAQVTYTTIDAVRFTSHSVRLRPAGDSGPDASAAQVANLSIAN
jgi:hypothetical protein